jgi:vacuolar-type H+-ATPase subunit D/Vma8
MNDNILSTSGKAFQKFISHLTEKLSKPKTKFITDLLCGILFASNLILTNIASKVPHLLKEISGEIIYYGFATISGEMDIALLALERAFDDLIELAEKEKQARLLDTELQMTRRRVNVLEHVVIPELHETIRFIYGKLAEAERDNTTRLMKIADIIRA